MSDTAATKSEGDATAEGADKPAETKDEHGAHGHHDHPPYMKIFGALCVLTVIEVVIVVGMAQFHTPIKDAVDYMKLAANASLVIFSLAKAVLVALYFMHLQMDNKRLMIVVLSPIFLSALLFIVPVLETLSSQAKL